MLSKSIYNKLKHTTTMELEIFSDETHVEDNNGKEYLGIACLFVPTSYKTTLSNRLSKLRCLNKNPTKWSWNFKDCKNECKEKYHNLNNFEIHSKKIENNMSKTKIEIYRRWAKFIVKHNSHQTDRNRLLYFNILYLDLDKLDFDNFGVDKDTTNIYNRFYRTVLLSAKSFYFKNQNITIKNIYHDNADAKKDHEYFKWHVIDYLNNQKRVNVKTDEITFISSNHREYEDNECKENAQLIQLIDLILGLSNQIIFQLSKSRNKIKVANDFYPLFKRLWNRPYNFNSSYNYFRSQQVSIFPKTAINSQKDFEGFLNDTSQFHQDIKISDPQSLLEQTSLEKWF